MNRPLYETKEDLERERQIIESITPFGVKAQKLPIKNHLDFAMVRDGKVTALIEVRCRSTKMGDYDTFMGALDKVLHARELSKACGCPAFMFVQWTDKLAYMDFNEPYTVGFGGRNSMRDSQDKALMAYFDINVFKEWER